MRIAPVEFTVTAKYLPKCDLSSWCDPYFKLFEVGNHKPLHTSNIKDDTAEATFDTFELQIDSNKEYYLEFWDDDSRQFLQGADDYIAQGVEEIKF